jgi:hypothetical protein
MTDFVPGPFADYETLERVARSALANGRANGLHDSSATAAEMRLNRQANMQRLGVIGGGYNGSGISFATARPRDPMFYWREANLPFEYTKDEEMIRLRQYARLVYLTDPVMASCIDVYSYWPLTGMHVEHSDQLIQDFYEELFFDENSGLNYEEFLPELLHEYWLTGEAFPLGHFNELLGIWEYDELINADDVKVVHSPFMREPRFEIKVPEDIRKIVVEREPKWEFAKLVQAYPEFLRLAQTEEYMPVSNDLMRQVAFKCVTWDVQVMTPSGPLEARRLERGDKVLAWDEDFKCPVISRVSYIEDNGTKPIYHVRTRLGRSLRVTGNHPCLTDQGWQDASVLAPGAKLVVGANNVHRSKPVDLDVARFLGIMVGDGSCGTKGSSQTIKVHSVDLEVLNWVNNFVGQYGCHLVHDKRSSWLITRTDGGKGPTRPNQVRQLLKDVGLFGHNTWTKRVPQVIWQGGPKAWAAFLSGYLDTDGYYHRARGIVNWNSPNRALLEDCQTLLAFLGVNSSIRQIKSSYEIYRLELSRKSVSLLAPILSALIPRKQVEDRGHYGVPAHFDPVLYDEVVSITVEEPEPTLAIGVDKYRNFITSGLVTHNSDKFHNRGLPIMMRAFRSLYQQEMLNAAMDSIASRLYTPLVLVRLGASAQDTGTDTAWVPTAQQLEEFQESLDIALAADFRVLTSHFATQVDLVFGREAMPDFGPDFDRLMDQKLLAFGLSRTMLMGASSGETYAADALNRDVVTQMLTRAQRHAKRHFAQRARLVAQAQEHYEVEKQGGRSKIVYQEVLVVDPDGSRRIERKPKLMQPKLVLDVLNLHDEQAERAFIETLVAQGIPISARTRLRGTEIDLDEELGKVKEEQVNRAVVAQETRKDLFLELQEKRLPIEEDLIEDFQAKPEEQPEPPQMMIDPMTGMPMAGVPGQDAMEGGPSADQGTPLPSPAVPPGDTVPLQPLTPEEAEENPPAPAGPGAQAPVATSGPGVVVPMQRQRPPESDEQRKRMPKASVGASNGHTNGKGKLEWHFTGNLDDYLTDWSDD